VRSTLSPTYSLRGSYKAFIETQIQQLINIYDEGYVDMFQEEPLCLPPFFADPARSTNLATVRKGAVEEVARLKNQENIIRLVA
jgi:hypothetical protein